MSPEERARQWERDCLKWRGVVLTGKHAHWCNDWDGLPVDETCDEWPCTDYATALLPAKLERDLRELLRNDDYTPDRGPH